MSERFKITKDNMSKLLIAVIVTAIFFLTMSILTDENDPRQRITDSDGGTESELCDFLSDIEGSGKVNALVKYDKEDNVTGVIVSCEGAENPVVKNNIIKGVSTLYNIPASSIMVFQKELGGLKNENEKR